MNHRAVLRVGKLVGTLPLRVIALCGPLVFECVPVLHASSAYEEIIAPIMRARCVECHGEQKQKAGLGLHTWDGLMRGSDGGAVITPGKSKDSVLLQRMLLPLDDEEHMPPSEKPQPGADEIAVIAAWIQAGAKHSGTMAELGFSADLQRTAAVLRPKLAALENARASAEPRWEFDPKAVANSRAPIASRVAGLQQRFPGALSYVSRTSPMLQFTAAALGRSFGDAEFQELVGIAGQLVSLDLAGTAISDQSSELWPRFQSMRSIRAGNTELGDQTVPALSRLPELEVLTLNDTRLSPQSVPALRQLPKIKALRLGGTTAEPAAREARLPVVGSMRDVSAASNLETKPEKSTIR